MTRHHRQPQLPQRPKKSQCRKRNDIRDGCGLADDPSGISTAPQSFRSPQETPFSHAMKVVRSLALVRGSRS